jgi:parallel beta-helix repeat protein
MKGRSVFFVALAFLFCPAFAPRAAAATLVVSNTSGQCGKAEFSTIQSAINAAAPGDTVRVCPGVYPEQVTIGISLTLRGENGAILMPGPVAQNGTDISSGAPLAAIILVQNAADVTVDGLIVDGSQNGITQCSPFFVGIIFQNASGRISHNTVRSISTPPVGGCQDGDAIGAQSSSGQGSTVEIASNSVHDYQKNGITANETGTTATIHDNTVTESAPAGSNFAAPNGIQIGFGAAGTINANTVSGNIWAPCVSVSNCTAAGSGILIFESDSVTIQNNNLGTNQFGIFVQGDSVTIRNNDVFNNLVLYGVAVIGNDARITNNSIVHSDQDAIVIQGNDGRIRENTITDALVGILTVTGSSGNTITDNTFYDTVTTTADPVSPLSVTPGASR